MRDDLNFNPARPKQHQNYMITNLVSSYDDLGRSSIENMIKNVDSKSIDYLEQSQNKGFLQKIGIYFNLSNPVEWIFLLFFSIVITVFILIFDKILIYGIEKRQLITSTDKGLLNFFLWISTAIILMLLATSVGYFISAEADGSGIPEIKTVLSGINIYKYFSFNAFIGKVIGLFCALVGGASVGKVGPYVHFSCLICNRLLKINYFSQINKSTSSKTNMLRAAVAAGITLALGTPLGGVLFSIETTASIYIVSNIWKSFFSAVICIFVTKAFQSTHLIHLIEITHSNTLTFNSEILMFIILGLVCGVIGAFIATSLSKLVYIRRKSKFTWLNNRFKYAAVIATFVGVVTFWLDPLHHTDKTILSTLFSNDKALLSKLIGSITTGNMFLLFSLKLIISVLSISMNVPAGVFGPILCIGALFGYFFGQFFKLIFDLSDEGIYSMVGAACVLSGASHTLSSALIIFEMTGQSSYLAPLLLATLIANLTAQSLSMNIFDVLLVIKNLPHLPSIKSQALYSLNSSDIMTKVNFYLETNKMTVINSMELLSKLPNKYSYVIPVVDDTGTIRYTIHVKNMYKHVYSLYESMKMSYNIKNQSNFNEYFNFIRKKFFSNKRSFFQQISYKFKKLYVSLRDKERLRLNKNFEEDSNWRLLTIFKDNAADDNIFLRKKLEIENTILAADKSALTVDKNFPALKVHFLFTFLNISHIFVTDNGQLAGLITKEDFIKKSMSLS